MLVLNAAQRATYWRAYQLARHLAPIGHQVTLIAASRDRRLGMVAKTEGILPWLNCPICSRARFGRDGIPGM